MCLRKIQRWYLDDSHRLVSLNSVWVYSRVILNYLHSNTCLRVCFYIYIFYFYYHLLHAEFTPRPQALFLQFLLECIFLLCSLLFWFRNNLLFFCRIIHLNVAGRALVCISLPMSSVSSAPHLGSLCTWMCSMTRASTSRPLSAALRSAVLSTCSKNPALLSGRRPCVQPHC